MIKSSVDKKFAILIVLLMLLGIASSAFALENDWPLSPGSKIELTNETTLAEMVKYFYEWGVTIGGLVAFLALVMAGFQYMTSAGDPSKMKEATERIKSAILGLVLLLGSYLVLNLINPELTTLRMPSLETPTSTLGGIVEEPPDITKPCEKATIYSQANYATGTELATITKGDCRPVALSRESGSIKVEGACAVELYSITSCTKTKDEPMYAPNYSIPNIAALYLPRNIQYIAVNEF